RSTARTAEAARVTTMVSTARSWTIVERCMVLLAGIGGQFAPAENQRGAPVQRPGPARQDRRAVGDAGPGQQPAVHQFGGRPPLGKLMVPALGMMPACPFSIGTIAPL